MQNYMLGSASAAVLTLHFGLRAIPSYIGEQSADELAYES